MEYAQQNRNAPSQATQARLAGANAPEREMPRLVERIQHLGKLLVICHEHAASVEHVAIRLTGPRPTEAVRAGEAQTQPPAETMEQKMQALVQIAEHLVFRLQNATAHLDSAV